jgi:seryl-tRNA synthetase
MHDAKALLEPSSGERLARRGFPLAQDELQALVTQRSKLIAERDALRSELKGMAREARAEAKARLRQLEEDSAACDSELRRLLLTIPNLPSDETPDGGPADPMVEVRTWGDVPEFGFEPLDHVELGTRLGILDQARAAKLSGARFAVTRGAGARLERALASFLLDLHTREHGYLEHGLPHLVTADAMTGTGQLPKFAEDLFGTKVGDRDLLLVPTAEVPLVNLYREEIVDAAALPLALTACTPCYRAEAGSYGRDTRGLIRMHQFEKVELVRLCHPEQAQRELQILLGHAEEGLRRLGLHYRIVDLRAGDLGFSARRTFDIEVWLPAQNTYREVSSCSDCGDFQGRRAAIRIREKQGKKIFANTLNGSGLPIGRTLVALLEQGQQADGSVRIPDALVPYAGFSMIHANGDVSSTSEGE